MIMLYAQLPTCSASSEASPTSPLQRSPAAPHRRELRYGSFRKLGVPYFGVLIIRILLFRVLYWGPLFSETPILGSSYALPTRTLPGEVFGARTGLQEVSIIGGIAFKLP